MIVNNLYEGSNLTSNEGFKAFYAYTHGLKEIENVCVGCEAYYEYSSGENELITVKVVYDESDFNLRYISIDEIIYTSEYPE